MDEKEYVCYSNKIVYLSFLMALLIIVRHSTGISVYQNLTGCLYYFELFMEHLSDLIVPMFFAISGFLFYQNYDSSKLISKWKTRFKSLVVPFFVWNLVGFLFAWLLLHIPSVSSVINRKIPDYNLLTWMSDVFIYTRYNVTWFIRNLIIYIVLTPLLFPVFRNLMGGSVLLLSVLLISRFYDYDSILCYSAPYLLGAFMSVHYKNICQKRYGIRIRILSGILLLFSIIIETYMNSSQCGPMVPVRMLQIPLLWLAADFLAIDKNPIWWMKISFFIYCCHSLILESVEKLFWIVFHDSYFGALLDYFFAPLITFSIILFFASIFRKQRTIWYLLNGGRGGK